MTYDILATGSSGNAVVINGEILIDCGVSMKLLRESGCIKSLKLVLLTHAHGDHFNPATVRALHQERPALRWGCCEWMVWEDREKRVPGPLLKAGVDRFVIDVFESEIWQVYTLCDVMPVYTIHDVPNCAWRIWFGRKVKNDCLLFYATDTSNLDHIDAKGYDLYLIEANHRQAEIAARIEDKLSRGKFSYEVRAAQNHLSYEQAMEWLAENAGPNSRYELLHQHKAVQQCQTG